MNNQMFTTKFFEFNSKIKQQIYDTGISTKFVPPYTCLFMDKFEASYLETQQYQPPDGSDSLMINRRNGEEELYKS